MFGKLKEILSTFANKLAQSLETRELKEDELSDALEELKLGLIESDVAYEIADKVCEMLKERALNLRVQRAIDVKDVVKKILQDILEEEMKEPPDLMEKVREKCERGEPFVVMVMGINGTGKTTSIAKLANYIKKNGLSVLLVAADTFRAGAQEQLIKHAERLNVPIIRAKYGSDPAAVAFDAIQYANKRKYCGVIVDTAGRMHTDSDLMAELKKIARVIRPDYKLLVVDSLTGNDAVEQAKTFDSQIGVDGFFITKIDADVKGGTCISVSMVTGKPILFLGTGQSYNDIVPFSKKWLIEKIVEEL